MKATGCISLILALLCLVVGCQSAEKLDWGLPEQVTEGHIKCMDTIVGATIGDAENSEMIDECSEYYLSLSGEKKTEIWRDVLASYDKNIFSLGENDKTAFGQFMTALEQYDIADVGDEMEETKKLLAYSETAFNKFGNMQSIELTSEPTAEEYRELYSSFLEYIEKHV